MAPPKAKNPKKSASNYRKNASSRAKKAEYDTKYQSKTSEKKKKAERAKFRRDKNVMGKGGKDASHRQDGSMFLENSSKNRARNRGRA